MYNDNSRLPGADIEHSVISMTSSDIHNMYMTGEITDKIFKDGKLVEVIEGHNLVVNSFLKLVMALCKGEAEYKGIQYWAVGSGQDDWDTTTPDPEINATKLTTEIGRVAIDPSNIKFLTSEYTESPTPTNILEIKHVFGTADCNGKWREFGIFGGNATEVADSGIMINKRHHNIITKTEDMTIERTMRFILSLT